mmetsp:Transcript_26816/g.47474  ORF Transcript_26816/g.47474 Transcript_26816/m.47474 type:complete len:314 (-) Transcript_26816:193-1134(-)|eukprot:CAMPEP_0197517856 /NCGR_PEP_ID=MMETSP1318-20131121/2946_1 /TAXON_ID=552666 /ORGANISM="Partenskyella glossopodia, Strain RCC365" /LENGTH=313 /DNA_ID=CAMNT_0043067761 /DNA_START=308 /DNA_END=1249 /DNA_ORIENTATION=+
MQQNPATESKRPTASSAAAAAKKAKNGGYSLVFIVGVVFAVLVIRHAVHARTTKNKAKMAHHHWIKLSESEMSEWKLVGLKGTPDPDRTEVLGDSLDTTKNTTKTHSNQTTPKKNTQHNHNQQHTQHTQYTQHTQQQYDGEQSLNVSRGLKVDCLTTPCNMLLPGNVGKGGIIEVKGTFFSCFDLILGDEQFEIKGNKVYGQAILAAIRSPNYIHVNTYENDMWQDGFEEKGKRYFSVGKQFVVQMKFLVHQKQQELVQMQIFVDGMVVVNKEVSVYLLNSMRKLKVIDANFRNCRGGNPRGTRNLQIEYLSH